MTLKLNEHLVIEATDPARLAEFWRQALEWEHSTSEEGCDAVAGPGSARSLIFVSVPDEKTVKNRLHIELSPTDTDQQADLTLADVARVAISLAALDPAFGPPGHEIGHALGARLSAPVRGPLPLPAAVLELAKACRSADFVELDLLSSDGEGAHLRLRGCHRILQGSGIVPRTVCDFDAGLFAGFLRHVTEGPPPEVAETTCIGRGDAFCEFAVRQIRP